MAFVHRARHPDFWLPQRKPLGRVEIDWTHPLSRGLRLYALPGRPGPVPNIAWPGHIGVRGATVASTIAASGVASLGQRSSATGKIDFGTVLDPLGQNWEGVTCSALLQWQNPSGSNYFPGIISNVTSENFFGCYNLQIEYDTVSVNRTFSFRAGNGSTHAIENGLVFSNGQVFRVTGSWDKTTIRTYRGHLAPVDSGTATQTTNFSATNATTLGYYSRSGHRSLQMPMIDAAIWDRPLSRAELEWYYAEPYAFLRPVKRRTVYAPAAAGGTTYSESISLAASAALFAAAAVRMAGAVTIAGSADAAMAARATFTDGITAAATAAASLDGTARFTDAAALAASAALSVSAGAQAFSESIALAATPAFDAAGALHLSGSIALGASADLAAAGSLRVGESVAFSATLDASAAASLTMREAIAAAATAAVALAASSPADSVIVRTVGLSGERSLVFRLEGRRNRTITLRGSLSN